MSRVCGLLMLAVGLAPLGCAHPLPDSPALHATVRPGIERLPRPTPAQVAWHDGEVGMFIHLAPQTWQDSESDSGATPLSEINPQRLNAKQWVGVAKSMGARWIVFVAKHEGGFCWWPTRTTDYSVKSIPWRDGKGDVLSDLVAEAGREGIRLGVYLSPQDRHHGVGVGGKATDPTQQAAYERMYREQLTEVLRDYGDMVEVWFDGSLVFDAGDIVERYAPRAVVFQGPRASIRWVGNEDGVAPYPCWNGAKYDAAKWGNLTAADGTPDGDRWLPSECDARMRATWFWRTDNEHTLKGVDELLDMYEKSVGRGAVLLLNATPDRTGLIPEADAARAAEFGAAVKRCYGNPIAETRGAGSELVIRLPGERLVDCVITCERIAEGERIRGYAIEALVDGAWKAVANGSAVGHKRIDRFEPVRANAVRLRVSESVGLPLIERCTVVNTGRVPR